MAVATWLRFAILGPILTACVVVLFALHRYVWAALFLAFAFVGVGFMVRNYRRYGTVRLPPDSS